MASRNSTRLYHVSLFTDQSQPINVGLDFWLRSHMDILAATNLNLSNAKSANIARIAPYPYRRNHLSSWTCKAGYLLFVWCAIHFLSYWPFCHFEQRIKSNHVHWKQICKTKSKQQTTKLLAEAQQAGFMRSCFQQRKHMNDQGKVYVSVLHSS